MSKSDKLARLRAARSGKKIIDNNDSDDDLNNNDIYEEVDDLEYRKHKRDQLLNDDFVVDDEEGASGYAENGGDDWDNNHNYYSDDEDDTGIDAADEPKRKKKAQKVKKVAQIDNFFQPSSFKTSHPSTSTSTKKLASNDLDDILNNFTSSVTKSSKSTPFFSNTTKRKDIFSSIKSDKQRTSSPSTNVKPLNFQRIINASDDIDEYDSKSYKKPKLSSDITGDLNFETAPLIDTSMEMVDAPSSPIKAKRESTIKDENILPDDLSNDLGFGNDDSNVALKEENKDDNSDDDSDDDVVVTRRPRAAVGGNINRSVNMTSKREQPESAKVKELPKEINSSPLKQNFTSNSIPASSSPPRDFSGSAGFEKYSKERVVTKSEDGSESFKMYWFDFAEVDNSLLLFGKIKTNTGELVSGTVQINGINRELYFLPREKRKFQNKENDEDEDEDEESLKVTTMDVHEEVSSFICQKYGLTQIRDKPEVKKYAFELPGVPKEAEYLKMLVPYQTPKSANSNLPQDLEGETFSRLFGANTTIFESFVLQRNIMGPCWLEIKNGDFDSLVNASHSKVEVAVKSPLLVSPIDLNDPAPDLNVLSISVQTCMNTKEMKQEIVSVSIALFRNLPQDAPIDENVRPDELVTLVRPPSGSSFPPGLKQLAEKSDVPLRSFNNEKMLLNCLAGMVKLADPDVFIGHRLENISLDVLMHRMHDLKVSTWSHFGRRNRKQWPDKFGNYNTRNNIFHLKEIFAGRLLCDIANEMGQSLTTKCQSWDLPEMFEVVCKKKHAPMEINFLNPQYSENSELLLSVFNENNLNVQIIAEVAFRMQILSLSKQLTNLAGNAWAHTLSGTRAGRNEYILLHEFSRNGYIVPDKESRYQRSQHNNNNSNQGGGEGDENSSNNKKSKYQGGLVFEPEKGLHKNYVLVMDFNSLYPSIIQEFNICFTTVDRSGLVDDEIPNVPISGIQQGVLPKLLNQLVSRRREVKKLMKDPRATTVEKAQYDIKQQALKLTANSMYGCLGYVHSRFYAKPLAMLVTNRGREILMDTRQLAESIGLRVVYGDTDSVMIDTGCDSFKDAIKIGDDFKAKVNERYKLLEIDIDNVFKRLLLHAKKKYAAMNATISPSGKEVTTLEVKGLDMKRREYCPLSKEVSQFVLEKILSDLDPEQALIDVYTHLEEMQAKLKNNEIPMVKLKINTRLSKDPSQYPGGKSMPAVQVALRLREQNKTVKAGTVITYVITDEGIEDNLPVPERARALSEILSKKGHYKVDSLYYLEKQIFAPVERLMERIEGSDVVRLASSLGLDSKRYEARARMISESSGINDLQPLESTIPYSERFRDSKSLILNCPHCHNHFQFGGLQSSNDYQLTYNGLKCLRCSNIFNPISLTCQLESSIRQIISEYYAGWLTCDDCGMNTRQMSVYGKRCIGSSGKSHGCKGVMRYKFSDKALYNQLLYFESLFDVDKAKKRQLKPLYHSGISAGDESGDASGSTGSESKADENIPVKLSQGELEALAEQNRALFCVCVGVVDKYLSDCGRRYVDMSAVFNFMISN